MYEERKTDKINRTFRYKLNAYQLTGGIPNRLVGADHSIK